MEEELRLSEEADRRKKEEEQRKQLAASQPAQESVSATPDLVKAMESPPYPGEGQYPPVTAAATPSTNESEPRILPPSTGETIASTRRAQLVELTEPPAENASPATPVDADPSATPINAAPNLEATDQAKDEHTPANEAVTPNG